MSYLFAVALLHFVVMLFLGVCWARTHDGVRVRWRWSHHCVAEAILAVGYLLIAGAPLVLVVSLSH